MSSVFAQAMTLVIFVFLTTRLSPEEFGVFALALVFIEFMHREGRFAMVDAIVQNQKLDGKSLSTAFWCATLVVSVICIGLVLISPWLGSVFNSDKLPPVLAFLALSLLPIPASLGPLAKLNTKMAFQSLSLRQIAAVFSSSVVALIIVFGEYPEWALVGQKITLITVETIYLQIAEPTRVQFQFDRKWASDFLKRSISIFSGLTVARWLLRIFDVIITVVLGPVATGIWRIAERIVEAALGALGHPLNTLWVITLSREGTTDADRNTFFLNMIQTYAVILAPVFAGIAIVSGDFTAAFLSEEYSDVALYLAIYAGFATLSPFYFYRNAALVAFKKSNVLTILSLLDIAVLLGMTFLLSQARPDYIVVGVGLTYFISIFPSMIFFLRETGASLADIWKRASPAYGAVGVMLLGCLLISSWATDLPALARLLILSASGGLIYAATLLVCFRNYAKATRELLTR